MATQVVTTAKLYVGEFDLSGSHVSVGLTYGSELVDDTAMGDTTRSSAGGLKTVSLSGEGFWSGGDNAVDDVYFDHVGVADMPVTVVPVAETLANEAYLFNAIVGQYSPGASIGEMLRFSVSAEGSGGAGLVRGILAHVGSETATGSETKQLLGAVSATQSVYAALHVLTVSGTNPTLDVLVRSDANADAGGETTRLTFTQATAITSEWESLVGAITDTYWDVSWTIGGTGTPTFEFVVSVGIK